MTDNKTALSAQSMMPLRALQILHYRYPLPEPIITTMGPVLYRPALVLRVEDSQGLSGWGEIWCAFPPDGDSYRAQLALSLLPRLLANQSFDSHTVFHELQEKLHRVSLQAGEPGPIAQICAGVDIAINDLAARQRGISLAKYLASNRSTTEDSASIPQAVKAYASGLSPEKFEQQIEHMRSCGYRNFKQRIGFGVDDSIPQLQAASRMMNTDETLMSDANQAWTLSTALKRIDQLEKLELDWLEEPLLADADDGQWQALAKATNIPLAGGENLRSLADFKQAIKQTSLSVIQPDICKWGGLSGCLEVARLAIKSNKRYCPHYLGGGIGLLASAQLLAATGHDGLLEVDSSENPLQEIFAGGNRSLSNGLFQLADGPGLGLVPDIDSAREFLISDHSVILT